MSTNKDDAKSLASQDLDRERDREIGQHIGYRYDVNLLPDYSRLTPIAVSKQRPADLIAAEYSIAIAGAAGADKYASSLYSTAQQKLSAAENAKHRQAPALAREAVLAGEDARREAMKGKSAADAQAAQARAADQAAEAAAQTAREAEAERAARTKPLVVTLGASADVQMDPSCTLEALAQQPGSDPCSARTPGDQKHRNMGLNDAI